MLEPSLYLSGEEIGTGARAIQRTQRADRVGRG